MKILELFGGIGACSKALEKLGIDYEIADYVEIDKYAVASFNAIHGTNFEPQDICTWNKDIDVDLIMHGSPCQDFSLSGKQAGGDEGSGTRSSLMYETIRIVSKLKPKYVIWENVKNLLSKKHKHNFDAYLEKMEELGYKNYYQVLNAKDYGIPQNRERVFTISILSDVDYLFTFPKKQELKLRLKDMLDDKVEEKYYLSDEKIEKISHWKGFQKPFEKVQGKNSIVPTLTARGAGEEHNGMITFSDNLENTTNLQEECLKVNVIGNYSPSNYDSSRIVDNNGLAPTVKENHGTVTATNVYSKSEKSLFTEDGNIKRYANSDIIDKFEEGQMATTTYPNGYNHGPRTHNESISLNTIDRPSVKYNLRIRKITPKESWRLMGFDDEDFDKASKVCSNSQLYKQAGNSIVVNVLMAIFKELFIR